MILASAEVHGNIAGIVIVCSILWLLLGSKKGPKE